jgi:hypothetical protein
MFDWIYMHFLVNRKITVKTGAWQNAAKGDTITFNFTIVKAGPSAAENMINYVSGRRVGGFKGHLSCPYEIVSAGSFTIYVDVNSSIGHGY